MEVKRMWGLALQSYTKWQTNLSKREKTLKGKPIYLKEKKTWGIHERKKIILWCCEQSVRNRIYTHSTCTLVDYPVSTLGICTSFLAPKEVHMLHLTLDICTCIILRRIPSQLGDWHGTPA